MLHGRVVRLPVINAERVTIDRESIRGIPGVVMIAREGKFVGVIAEHINWHFPEPISLRTSNLRAPGMWRAALPANLCWTRSSPT
jgi:hypothetical protein